MNLNELSRPFPPEFVKWRVGSTNKEKTKGMALAYADARAFMDRLDEIVGADKWQDEYFDSPSGRVFCKVGIKFDDEWIWKADGAGETQVEGEKGAISDAFKRACVKWGLGRYLYDLKSPWVEIEQRGNSYVIAKGAYPELNALIGKAAPKQPKLEPKKSEQTTGDGKKSLTDAQYSKADELRQALIDEVDPKVRLVCNYAVSLGIGYQAEAHALNALKTVPGKNGLSYDDNVSFDTAVKMLDFLIQRKLEAD